MRVLFVCKVGTTCDCTVHGDTDRGVLSILALLMLISLALALHVLLHIVLVLFLVGYLINNLFLHFMFCCSCLSKYHSCQHSFKLLLIPLMVAMLSFLPFNIDAVHVGMFMFQ